MSQDSQKIGDLLRRLENILRRGRVAQVQTSPPRVRVALGDDVVTKWLPWFATRAGDDRTWWTPSVGEQVLVLSESGNTANGVVLMGMYQDAHPPADDDAAISSIVWSDGARVSYDKSTGTLETTLPTAGELISHVGEAHVSMRNAAITLTLGASRVTLTDDAIELRAPHISMVQAS